MYVVARFLDVLYTNGGAMRKTNIQLPVGLRYPRFIEYLDWLQLHGLVERADDEEGVELYRLSSKGVESYHRLVEWMRDTVQGMKT